MKRESSREAVGWWLHSSAFLLPVFHERNAAFYREGLSAVLSEAASLWASIIERGNAIAWEKSLMLLSWPHSLLCASVLPFRERNLCLEKIPSAEATVLLWCHFLSLPFVLSVAAELSGERRGCLSGVCICSFGPPAAAKCYMQKQRPYHIKRYRWLQPAAKPEKRKTLKWRRNSEMDFSNDEGGRRRKRKLSEENSRLFAEWRAMWRIACEENSGKHAENCGYFFEAEENYKKATIKYDA